MKAVAYFSASGVTKRVAERLAEALNTKAYEIKPEVPYTSSDLNWQDDHSRSSVEMKDKSSRPAIVKDLDFSDADTVFVGFPIWWYREPSIIDTFLETYDFSGKTIVPFATSGSSGIGETGKRMAGIANTKVLTGKRFPSNVSVKELKSWVESL